jgi:protein TonB
MHLFQSENESLGRRALKLTLVAGVHAAALSWLLHAQLRTLSEPAPIRLDVRTIELPPPTPPKPVVEPPKPPPRAPRQVIQRPEPVTPPPVLTAAPSADPPPAAFTVAPQPPAPPQQEAVPTPPPPPAPVPITEARFDAAYLQNPAPAYPALSRRLREEGKVLLLVRVTAGGSAENIQIKQSSGFPRLDEAALGAVRQWRFVPARRGAEPIAASVMVPIVFRLE